jgi:hypothetical protein
MRASSARLASLCEGNVTSTVTVTADCNQRRLVSAACGWAGACAEECCRWRRRVSDDVMVTAVGSTLRPNGEAARISSTARRSAASSAASATESMKVVW